MAEFELLERTSAVELAAAEAGHKTDSYCRHDGERLIDAVTGISASVRTAYIHDLFTAMATTQHYPCIGAKAAVARRSYRFGLYGELGAEETTRDLSLALDRFVAEQEKIDLQFATFVTVYQGPAIPSEHEFERLLWKQVQALADLDAPRSEWDPKVSSNPDDPKFSFSYRGSAYFVVGFNPTASRIARRFGWPLIIFNAHSQFERMRAQEQYTRFRDVVRARDTELQSFPNPMLDDFGKYSEARQYSGRNTEEGWRCPFHPPAKK